MSIAKQLESELGPDPGKSKGAGGPPRRDTLFGLANSVETRRVLDWLNIEHDDKFARCPGCGEEGALICDNGGLKCMHDRCANAGVPGKKGFRTNVDLAECVRSGTAIENAKAICEHHGIKIPERKPRDPAGDDEAEFWEDRKDPIREPGDDSEEVAKTKQTAKVAEARVLTVRQLLEQSGLRALRRERPDYCTTGHWRIDDITGGFQDGFVWLLGADTSWGKSSWLVSVADENIRYKKKRVLIVSAEDDEKLYGDRILVRRSGVDAKRFQRGRLTREEVSKVTEQMAKGEDVPVFLDARGRTIEWVARELAKIIPGEGISLAALDYVQALDNEKRQQDKRNQISYIGRKFTDAVKTTGRAGLLLSQVTTSDKQKSVEIDKHSIRDSRDLSHAAEIIGLGIEPDRPIMSGGRQVADVGQKCMKLDKVKNGPRGAIVPMDWDQVTASFRRVVDPDADRIEKAIGDMSEFDRHPEWYP